MDNEWERIVELSQYIDISEIFDIIAREACEKYYDEIGQEFLLSDACVAYEIQEHYYAYMWSIDQRMFPNMIAFGFLLKVGRYDADAVYEATRSTDMRESDVVAGGGISSQATVFGYRNGIRDCYIGTERDPWKDER